MTQATSVGPDVEAILNSDDDSPAKVVSSSFGESGAGQVEITRKESQPQQEELIGGKFKSQEDLLKAYKELEGKLGKQSQEDKPEDAEGEPDGKVQKMGEENPEGEGNEEPDPEEEGEGNEEDSEENASKGLDLTAYTEEFAANGNLSDESFEALEKAGIPRSMVEQYIAGVEAIQQNRGSQLFAAAGGEDEFNAIVKWGTANLDSAQQEAFNNAVNTAIIEGDLTAASMMISAVKSQMGGAEPNLLDAKTGQAPGGVEPFKSRSDMAAAMRDPRYRNDAAYVAEVQARLAASDF